MEDATRTTGSGFDTAAANAQRAVDEVRKLLDVATREDLAERAAEVQAKLAEARDTLTRAAAEASNSLRPVLREAEKEFREEIESVEQHVRDNPVAALLAAAGVGLLLGLAIARHR